MAEMVELRCPCCQSTSVVALSNGMYKCQSCQNDFFYDIGDNQRSKLNTIIDLRQRLEFEDALELLDTFISENSSVADGYYQKLLCKAKGKFFLAFDSDDIIADFKILDSLNFL